MHLDHRRYYHIARHVAPTVHWPTPDGRSRRPGPHYSTAFVVMVGRVMFLSHLFAGTFPTHLSPVGHRPLVAGAVAPAGLPPPFWPALAINLCPPHMTCLSCCQMCRYLYFTTYTIPPRILLRSIPDYENNTHDDFVRVFVTGSGFRVNGNYILPTIKRTRTFQGNDSKIYDT